MHASNRRSRLGPTLQHGCDQILMLADGYAAHLVRIRLGPEIQADLGAKIDLDADQNGVLCCRRNR